ncbi:hypothetical protein J6590_038379 [Homalodisca vitripennis]|nr:hypothetical protein J6590_038379 [Homalodisca vitripennis]
MLVVWSYVCLRFTVLHPPFSALVSLTPCMAVGLPLVLAETKCQAPVMAQQASKYQGTLSLRLCRRKIRHHDLSSNHVPSIAEIMITQASRAPPADSFGRTGTTTGTSKRATAVLTTSNMQTAVTDALVVASQPGHSRNTRTDLPAIIRAAKTVKILRSEKPKQQSLHAQQGLAYPATDTPDAFTDTMEEQFRSNADIYDESH